MPVALTVQWGIVPQSSKWRPVEVESLVVFIPYAYLSGVRTGYGGTYVPVPLPVLGSTKSQPGCLAVGGCAAAKTPSSGFI